MMKKYFIKESHEEIEFGDIIGLSYEKKHAFGKEEAFMKFEFVPELVDMLLKDEVIIVEEVEEPKKEVKTEDSKSVTLEDVMAEIERLTNIVKSNMNRINRIEDSLTEKKNTVKLVKKAEK